MAKREINFGWMRRWWMISGGWFRVDETVVDDFGWMILGGWVGCRWFRVDGTVVDDFRWMISGGYDDGGWFRVDMRWRRMTSSGWDGGGWAYTSPSLPGRCQQRESIPHHPIFRAHTHWSKSVGFRFKFIHYSACICPDALLDSLTFTTAFPDNLNGPQNFGVLYFSSSTMFVSSSHSLFRAVHLYTFPYLSKPNNT